MLYQPASPLANLPATQAKMAVGAKFEQASRCCELTADHKTVNISRAVTGGAGRAGMHDGSTQPP